MAKKTAPLLPSTNELLRQLGDRLRLARLRRRLTAKQVSERAGMAPMTLRSLERGGAGVTMGAYLAVMQVLGIEKDIDLLAKADPLGRELQDARLPMAAKTRARVKLAPPIAAPRGKAASASDGTQQLRKAVTALPSEQLRAGLDKPDWIKKSGFANSETLISLLDPVPPSSKRRR